MRVFPVEIGGLQLDLSLTFTEAKEIGEKVCDIMRILHDARAAAMLGNAGVAYKPSFEFTADNIPLIIWIGAKAKQPELKLSQVQEAVCDDGFVAGARVADAYLAQFLTPVSKEIPAETPKDTDAGN